MKIAITGHTAGIGLALAEIYAERGHDVVGLSRRNGYNIKNKTKIIPMIEPCDMFINNAQSGFTQTELLFDIWKLWQGQKKRIMVISTMMTLLPVSTIPGVDMEEYRLQKLSLEQACSHLSYLSMWPAITLVRPGAVATQPEQSSPEYADVTLWAKTLVNILESLPVELSIPELSLMPNIYGQ